MPSNLIKKYQQSFLTNSFYLYMSILRTIFYLFSLYPSFARTVGASEFGKIGIAQTFGILIILFMEFGSSLMVTKEKLQE